MGLLRLWSLETRVLRLGSRHQQETTLACRNCKGLSHRSRHLDSLTSPASETSALLSQASSNLTATSTFLKDAREKFDTVADCETAVERMYCGAREACREVALHAERQGRGNVLPPVMRGLLEGSGEASNPKSKRSMVLASISADAGGSVPALTEQELYAGADAMDIVRDAHAYFSKRRDWRSTGPALEDLNRVHHVGVDAMCLLVTGHLTGAGAAVRRKVDGGGGWRKGASR